MLWARTTHLGAEVAGRGLRRLTSPEDVEFRTTRGSRRREEEDPRPQRRQAVRNRRSEEFRIPDEAGTPAARRTHSSSIRHECRESVLEALGESTIRAR